MTVNRKGIQKTIAAWRPFFCPSPWLLTPIPLGTFASKRVELFYIFPR